jgi:hypothetical protein
LLYIKLHTLTKFLISTKPSSVIEFGTGYTTQVLSHYQKIHDCLVELVDENEMYAKKSVDYSGIKAKLNISKRIKRSDYGRIEIFYDYIPSESFELALIDGPNFQIDNVKYTKAISTQIIRNFEKIGLPRYILVDGRDSTSKDIAKEFNYTLIPTDLRQNFTLKKFNFWNILTLNL